MTRISQRFLMPQARPVEIYVCGYREYSTSISGAGSTRVSIASDAYASGAGGIQGSAVRM